MLADFIPLIKNKNFRFLWTSQVLSQITINIMNFLLLIRLFNNTGSTIATSLLWVAYALPAIIIGPFAAASVDMFDRRKLLMITNFLQSAIIFFYALSHRTSIFLLYGVAMSYSFLNQFYVPAELATMPSIVQKKNLSHANGLFFLTQTASLIFGFGVAGILNFFLGFSTTLYLCALFLFIAYLAVTFLPKMPQKESVPTKFESAFINFFKRIIEGYRFIRGRKSVLFPFLLLMALQVSIAVVVVNVPVLATDILQMPVESSGLAIVVPVGVGTALGAVIFPKLLKQGWRKKKTIEISLMVLITAIFLLAFAIPTITNLSRIFLGIMMLLITGLSFVGILIPTQTFLQETTPGGLRGRVFGNYWFLVTIATIFPVIFSGAITEVFNIRILYLILSALGLSVLLFSKKYGQMIIDNSF